MEASEESLLFADVPRQTASRFIIYDYSPRYYKLRPYRGVLQESHLPTSISDEDEDNSEYENNSEDGLIDNIHYAIECDNLDAVQKHLDDPAALESVISYRLRPSEVPQKDVTPLMLAAELGGRANVELLLNRGANVFATTNTNTTALHLAAEEGYENIVEILLGRGGTKLLEMATIHGRTPLLAAAYKGHASVVKLLLDKGADIDAMERVPDYFPGGWKLELSAFSLAAQQGHVSVLDILLSRISETKFEDDYGSQALHYAAGYGHLVVVKRLLKDHFRLLNSQGIRGETAVSLAMRNGNLDIFLYLLDKGADISGKGDTGGTFLYQAVRHAHLQAVNLILTKEPNLLDVQIKMGQTAIFAALENDQLEIFDYLFDKGADITIKDWSGNTPLHYAAQHGHLQAVDRTLEKEDGLLDLQNHDGKTAISLALVNGHLEIFNFLFVIRADITSKDQSGNTSLHYAAKAGHLQALGQILAREPSLLNSKGEAGQTGLLCALRHCRMDVARYLIEEGVDITLAPDDGQTALEVACAWAFYEITSSFQGRTIIVKGSIYSWTERLDDGDSLYDAVLATTAIEACVPIVFQLLEAEIYFPRFPARAEPHFSGIHEFTSVERFLLQIYDGEIDDIDMKTNVINKHGDAILYWAILNGQEELVSKCMSEIQNLQAPWERGGASWAHVAALGGNTKILGQLLLNGICTLAPTQENITPLHLAVKHHYPRMVRNLLVWLSDFPILHQSDAHARKMERVVVVVGDILHEIPSVDLETESEISDEEHCTLFEAKGDRMIDALRDILREEGGVLRAIIRKQDDGENSISLVASASVTTESHRRLERLLWDFLNQSTKRAGFFSNPLQDDAKLILELAAQFETPGEESYLTGFLNSIPRPLLPETSGLGTLHLAVYHKLPVVVWWLLSNGWDLSGNQIEKGQHIISTWEQDDPIRNIIKEILENPPPLRKDHASRYDEHIPAFEFFPSNHGLLDGTVLDFCHEEHQASIQLKRRSIATIIYHEGPRNIMKPGQYLDLSSLKAVLSSPGESSKETQKRGGITAALGRRDKSSFEKQRVLDLRWIHLPGNDLLCVEELMVRISQDQNITNKEHRPWADFVRKSWAELPAGGNKFYMKPQCVHYQRSKTAHCDEANNRIDNQSDQTLSIGRSALYIPYLFWKKCPAESPHTTDERSVQLTESATATQTKIADLSQTTQRREIFHDSLTLDQYYYSSLEDTTTRDKDQVLWRSTDPKLNPRESKSGRNVDLLENRQTSDDRRKILIVNQLWLWILDEKTIITSTTSEIDETESSFLQRVLNNVRAQEKNSPMTVENIQELILSTATSFFNKKDVEVLGNKKSPLGVYRTAILNVRDKESHLFDVFQKSLDDVATDNEGQESSNEFSNQSPAEAKGPGESQNDKKEPGPIGRLFKSKPKTWKGRDTYNPYGNIAGETELLREVKDICDELNMLKSLAVDQEGVWNQVWKNGSNQEATFTYNTPFEVRKEITEMVKEAEFVQKAIDMLLDLKQKQANIVEAEFARKQSEDTAKQSDTIMAFTVVTILFLPASFLTSLLALDISDFPHVGDDVRFQGRVIFPIIFGVSISVSVSFAIIAYNASTLKEYVFGRRKSQKTNKPTNSPVEPKPPTVQQARQQAKLQMEQIRERFKLNKGMRTDDEYSWSGSGSDQMV